jgi:predicted cupin superfamily sugar epimerase
VTHSREHVDAVIAALGLERLPVEGVLFRQTWKQVDGDQVIGTVMIGMLTDDKDSISVMHRLRADEAWHFYAGDPIRMLLLHPDGTHAAPLLGPDVLAGHLPQIVVPAGTWMGAALDPGGTYALFGNTMAPGFTSEMFEAGERGALCAGWPAATEMITALTSDHFVRDMPSGY